MNLTVDHLYPSRAGDFATHYLYNLEHSVLVLGAVTYGLVLNVVVVRDDGANVSLIT